MPTISRPTAEIHYDVIGETGPFITFVNGHTRSSSDFRAMARRCQEAGFRSILIDNRGTGESTFSGSFSIDDMADDVAAVWADANIDRSHVLGVSMGGMMALKLAARENSPMASLVLMSTTLTRSGLTSSGLPWGDTAETVKAKLARFFAPDFPTRNKLLMDAMAKRILASIQAGKFSATSEAQLAAMKGYDGTAFAKAVKVPTLIVHGAEDQVIERVSVDDMVKTIPGARLEIIEKAGHLLLAEAPEELARILIGFWKGLGE